MNDIEKSSVRADLILLLVAAIWGGGFVAGKMALAELAPLAILAARFCGSAIVFGVLFWKRIRKSSRKVLRAGILIGSIQFLALFIQMYALQYTSSMKQSFLASTYVVFTPFAAWLFTRIRPAKRDLTAALLAVMGVGMISLNGDFSFQTGDLMTLGFACLFSFQIVLVKKYGHDMDSIALSFYQFAAAGVLSLLSVLMSGGAFAPCRLETWAGLGYLVLINTALAICLQNFAQKRSKPSHAALLLSLESVFGFLFSALFYRDPVTLRMLAGCGLVLSATLISKMNGGRGE